MIIFNSIGLIIFGVSFGAAIAIGKLLSINEEGPLMLIGGPLIIALDAGYRMIAHDGDWTTPDRGGSLFFLPAWCVGIFWTILGAIYSAGLIG